MTKAEIEARGWREIEPPFFVPNTTAWFKDGLKVLYSIMESHKTGLWNHASVSRIDRYPSWDEIVFVRYSFFTEWNEVFQYLPPKREYLNLHPNYCFHLWHKLGARLLPPHF